MDDHRALLTDLYELTMLQSYFERGMNATAVFDLFVRRLPSQRNYLVACGLDEVLGYLETLRFSDDSLAYLRTTGKFSAPFLDHLRDFRFTGDVYAMPEGSIMFANEPIVEIVAPLPEAQLVESYVMNQIHLQTLAASKAARIVTAAAGRGVVDFGLRRAHGSDAAIKAARAFHIVGVQATSNLLAGMTYGIPVAGTMAHSYIQTFSDEFHAFSSFVETYPSTILLVDTYDTLDGVRHVVELKQKLGEKFRVQGIRIDSGNLLESSRQARAILDAGGLAQVQIVASNSLDEYSIAQLVAAKAPIDSFGVGVRMSVSNDAPYLDTAYKLVEYDGQAKMKLSADKTNLPGRKQVFRHRDRDVIGRYGESTDGDARLVKVMDHGRRIEPSQGAMERARVRFQQELERIPQRLLGLDEAVPPFPVEVSAPLAALRDSTAAGAGTSPP